MSNKISQKSEIAAPVTVELKDVEIDEKTRRLILMDMRREEIYRLAQQRKQQLQNDENL